MIGHLPLCRCPACAQIRETAARKEIEGLVALLAEVEWVGHTLPGGPVEVWHECPVCESVKTDGHAEGCRLAAALRGTPEPAPSVMTPGVVVTTTLSGESDVEVRRGASPRRHSRWAK